MPSDHAGNASLHRMMKQGVSRAARLARGFSLLLLILAPIASIDGARVELPPGPQCVRPSPYRL